jgi:DMSO/TMAO reductase YedYZ molybdopterin-dependent catalytic subunit
MTISKRAAVALLLGLWAAPVRAQSPVVQMSIGGRVETPATYTMSALASLPALEVQAPREGGAISDYVGTPLWPLLAAAKPVDGPGRGAHLQHALLARGADGYAVLLAIGEIDPGFEGKPVIIAYKQDGAVLAAPRLVVPGDHRAGRNVRELVSIDVQ